MVTVLLALASGPAGDACAARDGIRQVLEPTLVFDVSDSDLPTPLGAIADVAAGPEGIFLLDYQNFCVWYFDSTGSVLGVLGRKGEGPGDIAQPSRLALARDARVFVLDHFSRRISCLTPTGHACASLDASALLSGYAMTAWFRTDSAPDGTLYLGTLSNRFKTLGNSSMKQMGTVALVRRYDPKSNSIDIVLSTDAKDVAGGATLFSLDLGNLVAEGWDIGDDGTLLYADPEGGYAVWLRNPAAKRATKLELAAWPNDKKQIEEFKRHVKLQRVPAIASVQWIDASRFSVRPAAEVIRDAEKGVIGTFEVFDRDGSSYGRHTVSADYRSERDDLFRRGNLAVIVQEGKALASSALQLTPRNAPVEERDVRIRVYRLFDSITKSPRH